MRVEQVRDEPAPEINRRSCRCRLGLLPPEGVDTEVDDEETAPNRKCPDNAFGKRPDGQHTGGNNENVG